MRAEPDWLAGALRVVKTPPLDTTTSPSSQMAPVVPVSKEPPSITIVPWIFM